MVKLTILKLRYLSFHPKNKEALGGEFSCHGEITGIL